MIEAVNADKISKARHSDGSASILCRIRVAAGSLEAETKFRLFVLYQVPLQDEHVDRKDRRMASSRRSR